MPPYGDINYWNNSYQGFDYSDCFEWGNVSFHDLKHYDFQQVEWDSSSGNKKSVTSTTTLGKTLSVESHGDSDQAILMLGCGNSRLAEDMLQHGWRGPIIQVDVSSRVIESMSHRCSNYIVNGDMNFVEDDATELSAFRSEMMHACIDKGLIDAMYTADEYQQCSSIIKSVQRVLKPGGVFVFLSFSRPEFLLPKIAFSSSDWNRTSWESIQVQELPQIMLYRLQKASNSRKRSPRKPKKAKTY